MQQVGLTGPEWDNRDEYTSHDAKEFRSDFDEAARLIEQIQDLVKELIPYVETANNLVPSEKAALVKTAQEISRLNERATTLLWNLTTYVSGEVSVDGFDEGAKSWIGQVQEAFARLEQSKAAWLIFLRKTSDDVVQLYLDAPHTKPEAFWLSEQRRLADFSLTAAEEDLLAGMRVHGPTAFGNLYDDLSGTVQCVLDEAKPTELIGLAKATAKLEDADPGIRKNAYAAINKAWSVHGEAVAAILNSLAGWRLQEYRRRSHKRPMHFLDPALISGKLKRETLEAMMGVAEDRKALGRRAVTLQAKALSLAKLGPWDLFAAAPASPGADTRKFAFGDAIDFIQEAFSSIDPKMGKFVSHMVEKHWIEGRVGDAKRPGAYCSQFGKSRNPRVYMTYTGGMREVMTLAHELGHAFHAWIMKDMPLAELEYPMTLAETASIFAETVLASYLGKRATSDWDLLPIAWAEAKEIEGLTINIPARFEFERALYEKRSESRLSVSELRELMRSSWETWYGDSLSEMNDWFWASKLHFSIAETSFYNFPYLFGYLFSLGVYAERDRLGDGFFDAYCALLRDTGRMSTEELAKRHLGADLTERDFWEKSYDIVEQKIQRFEALLNRLF